MADAPPPQPVLKYSATPALRPWWKRVILWSALAAAASAAIVLLGVLVVLGLTVGTRVRVEVANRSGLLVRAFTLHTPGGKSAAFGTIPAGASARGSFRLGYSENGPVSATVTFADGRTLPAYLIDDYIDSDDFLSDRWMKLVVRRDEVEEVW